MGLRQIGAHLQGHPDMNRTPGVEVSTGSLGQGLSMCLGIALALRLDGLVRDRARVRPALRRRLPGGPDLGGGDRGAALRGHQPDRDRRLQPPADRRHHRGGHGHRRRARQVRVLRLGRGRDRRPRHDRGGRGARAQPRRSTVRRRSSARRPRARASRRWRAASASTARRRSAPSSPPRRSRSSRRGSSSRPRRCTAPRGRTPSAGRGQDRADRDPRRLRRGAARPRRGPRGRRRPRRRPRGLDPVDQVRQGVPGAVLQLRRRGGEHDVDGLRARGRRARSRTPRPSRSSPPAAPTTRSGSGSPTTSSRSGSAPRTAASRWARTAPRTR